MASFECPEIYSFPPFFTLQPVDSTRAKQLQQWCQLITAWHEAHKQTTMTVKEWPLWENRAIGRRLSEEGIAAVIAKLIANGNADWEDASCTRCKIFYLSPAEWGAKIHKFIVDNGMATPGNIYTVYELHSGRVCENAEFFGMDPFILMKALESLEKTGLCQLFPGSSMDECGVTFKER